MLCHMVARVPQRDQRPRKGYFLEPRNSLSFNVHYGWGLPLHGRCPTARFGSERQTIRLKIAPEILQHGPCLYMRRLEDVNNVHEGKHCETGASHGNSVVAGPPCFQKGRQHAFHHRHEQDRRSRFPLGRRFPIQARPSLFIPGAARDAFRSALQRKTPPSSADRSSDNVTRW